MSKIPPHLPKPMSNIKNHQLRERVKIITVALIVSLVAGFSGASVLFGWLLPNGYGNSIFISSYQNKQSDKPTIDDASKQELTNKIFSVYLKTSKISNVTYLDKKDLVGNAVIISSDGWLVMYTGQDLTNNLLVISDRDNKIIKIEDKKYDKYSGLMFLKINNINQLRVVNFVGEIDVKEPLFIYQNNNWTLDYINEKVANDNEGSLDVIPRYNLIINNQHQKGLLAVDSKGKIVGFLTDNQNLLESKYLTRILSDFLVNKSIVYESLGIQGFYDFEKPIVITNQIKNAFVINRVIDLRQSQLRVGDIILELNNSIVNEDNLWYNINNQTSVNIKLLRNGKTLELVAPIIKL